MLLVSVWHNDGSNVSTLEKKTLKIYHVLEDLNKLWDIGNIPRVLEANKLLEEFAASKYTMHRLTVGKSYRSCRSLPHELTLQQAHRRVGICRQLIDNPIDDRFIRRIVTCDEKWVFRILSQFYDFSTVYFREHTTFQSTGGSPGNVGEVPVTYVKQRKGCRMSCDVGKANM